MKGHLYRIMSLLMLCALLLSTLALPGAAPSGPVQAGTHPASDASLANLLAQRITQDEAEDAQLVRPLLQRPIQDQVFYFVMPDRFENGATANDYGDDPGGATTADVLRHGFLPPDKGYFHGGDLAGLLARLDYLDQLGVGAIWLTPSFKNRPVQGNGTIAGSSAGYHGYWITDFTQIDPHLGTNQELRDLIAAAHTRGMKVFFDIITNHTADVIDYEGGQYTYRSKENFPYRDAAGQTFDDADYAGTDSFPALDPATSFPYQPVFRTGADATVKQPAWLNNPIYYHNRGDSSFSGENSLYGDFYGLDDLFTEQPAVVDGMTDIYAYWVREFGIDGFRIDTVKHVNMEFWQSFGPAIEAEAAASNQPDFFMFGEVFSSDIPFISSYSTTGKLPAVLDFGFQGSARGFAGQGSATDNLRDLFQADDYYTDADSNAYSLPTFLGNHDIGRIGGFLKQDRSGAPDADLLARDRLAHTLMFLARGMPVIYYGDEQGFTGDGGDKDARQDMFPSQVASYNDDDLIGTDATTAQSNFDQNHPLYQTLAELGQLREGNRALRRGAQIHRYSSSTAGIYAFSRIDRDERIEYVVALNNAASSQSATFKTFAANMGFTPIYPSGGPALTSDGERNLSVTVPALSAVVYRANSALPASTAAPGISITTPSAGASVTGRFEVGAQLDSDQLAEVTFAVKIDDGAFTPIGTDGNAPYRVFYDASELPAGTRLSFKAIVNDLAGHLNSASVDVTVGSTDPGSCPAPAYAIIHYQRSDGNYEGWGLHLWGDAIDPSEATDWATPKPFVGQDSYGRFAYIRLADASQPLNFIIHRGDEKDTPNDRSFVPAETPEVWLRQGDAANHAGAAAAQGYATVRYQRPGGDYGSGATAWGLHLWGDGLADGVATDWAAPRLPDGIDADGAYFNIPLSDPSQPVNFIVHTPSGDTVPDTREPGGDRSFVPDEQAIIWLNQGDAAVYPSQGAAEDYAIIHYHRNAGDYGDYESPNFGDYWGLHTWTGAATPTSWSAPLKPIAQDDYGVTFRVPLVDGATTLNYILHKGDAKDLPEDQELDLTEFGHEIWLLESTPDYLLPLVECVAVPPCVNHNGYAIVHYRRPAGDYGSPGGNDYWGLHLWGDAIDPSETTDWNAPKPFVGEDAYGRFAYIKLADGAQPLNFIVHTPGGDTVPTSREPGGDRSFIANQTPQIWLKQGDPAIYTSEAAALGTVTVRYQRPGGDYGSGATAWGLHLWGDGLADGVATDWAAPRLPDGIDAQGAYFHIPIDDPAQPVNFIVHTPSGDTVPDTREPGGDRSFVPLETPRIWLKQGDPTIFESQGAAADVAVIHYRRNDGDYGNYDSPSFNDYWGLHIWTGAATPTEWSAPLKPASQDNYGVTFRVPLADGATTLNYILHKGDTKDLPEDQELDLTIYDHEIWILQNTPTYLLPIVTACGGPDRGDLTKRRAHWVTRDTLAWDIQGGAANTYALHYDPTGAITLVDGRVTGGQSIPLTFDPAGLSPALRAKFPHLANFAALKLRPADLNRVADILKGQFVVAATGSAGNQIDATGVQLPGVLDDLFTYSGKLGVTYTGTTPSLKLWAPTARTVKLHLFDNSTTAVSTTLDMTAEADGVWSATGTSSWTGKYYLYEVEVYAPSTGRVERNLVTDPYAISLSMNSTRSQIVNLAAANLKPSGWDSLRKPALTAPEDIVLYELHVRDFSAHDTSIPAQQRGTFKAFTNFGSIGMRHLRALARAGMTHIHLLPVFDIATIEEDKSLWRSPDEALLRSYPPDSDLQQAAVAETIDSDGFNWGYDPYHYTTPEGSYSTSPDGTTRIREFREMVQALNRNNLRVVMDVVYNHTNASGQNARSVLDKVVPGYYHRLDQDGRVTTSTCCQNTASEHAMMEKLMIDSVVTWATAYKVDGFRFDLMGHHMKTNMQKLRTALDALTMAQDGVDGHSIYVYGEGWNFGEVADNQRGTNATQLNMPGTGIGTFSDRLRDAVRGGGPFSGLQEQGFATGLYYDPNTTSQGTPDAQKARLLHYSDQIKVGLAGNLRDFQITNSNGDTVTGAQVDYNGQPAGYTLDPQEVITYVEAHDNETLFDAIQLKAAPSASLADRVRMQNMAISLVMLSQGVPFFQAGQDLLRSKSLDRNSYNSGDWFNTLDLSYRTSNWGAGLPPAGENANNWSIMGPLLANAALKPGRGEIMSAAVHFQEMLKIRKSSPLFRLRTAQEVQNRVHFLNNGPSQIPGLIVMTLDDTVGGNLDRRFAKIVVLFNASDSPQTFAEATFQGQRLVLHPVQALSRDRVVRGAHFDSATGTFSVPARTTAVFVMR